MGVTSVHTLELTDTNELTSKYVLKVTNSYLSIADQGLRDAARLMEFLSSRGFSCTQPVSNRNGDWCQFLTFENLSLKSLEDDIGANRKLKDTFMIRLVTFLPGTTLINFPKLVPDNVFEESGETLAKFHLALQELDMDKRTLKEVGENSPWSLNCLPKWRSLLFVVEDLQTRQMIEDVITTFEITVLSKRGSLPHGFIHGDFNNGNILVEAKEGSNDVHMTGFIDMDDACYSCIVYDVGISLMYVLQCNTISSDFAAGKFLLGYSRYRRLSQLEKDCLFYCTAGRFVQSLLGGLYSYSLSKNEYVLCSQQRGWNALKDIWKRGKEATYHKWSFS